MSPTHDPRLNAIWDLKSFTRMFERFAFEIYGNNEHSSLGVSPNQAMQVGLARTGMRDSRIIPWTVGTYILTLPSTPKGTAMVVPGRGVKIMHLYYFHPLMRESRFHGTNVPVRYDPFDRASAYVYLSNEWRPCVSEMANFFRGRSEREIEFASSELNARQSRNGQRRDTNAQSLAAFIQEAECEETILRQRQRDLEYHVATEQSDEPLAAHCANDTEPEFDHAQNPWATEHVISFEVCK